ncbi:MAG: DUF4256 domain-containing protein [Verrucomicrobiales bacterium]|nr:DUF4256 domain-containing protein [Verrucomicrobiales bacterium]
MKNSTGNKKELSTKQREKLLKVSKDRFEKNMARHQGLVWAKVQARLEEKSKEFVEKGEEVYAKA